MIDASIILASYFRDEQSDYADRVVAELSSESGAAPPIWMLEIANGLLQSERRGRSTVAESARILKSVGDLPVELDDPSASSAAATINIARIHSLTAYDAAYLELAMRTGYPLATLDDDLRTAAKRVGVELVL